MSECVLFGTSEALEFFPLKKSKNCTGPGDYCIAEACRFCAGHVMDGKSGEALRKRSRLWCRSLRPKQPSPRGDSVGGLPRCHSTPRVASCRIPSTSWTPLECSLLP